MARSWFGAGVFMCNAYCDVLVAAWPYLLSTSPFSSRMIRPALLLNFHITCRLSTFVACAGEKPPIGVAPPMGGAGINAAPPLPPPPPPPTASTAGAGINAAPPSQPPPTAKQDTPTPTAPSGRPVDYCEGDQLFHAALPKSAGLPAAPMPTRPPPTPQGPLSTTSSWELSPTPLLSSAASAPPMPTATPGDAGIDAAPSDAAPSKSMLAAPMPTQGPSSSWEDISIFTTPSTTSPPSNGRTQKVDRMTRARLRRTGSRCQRPPRSAPAPWSDI